MKLITLFLGLSAIYGSVFADSETFGLVSIRSASRFHFLSVGSADGTLKLGANSAALGASITDDGKLKLSDGLFAVVDSDGTLKEGPEEQAAVGFSVETGHLRYLGSDSFFVLAAPESDPVLAVRTREGEGVFVALRAQSLTGGSTVPDFVPTEIVDDQGENAFNGVNVAAGGGNSVPAANPVPFIENGANATNSTQAPEHIPSPSSNTPIGGNVPAPVVVTTTVCEGAAPCTVLTSTVCDGIIPCPAPTGPASNNTIPAPPAQNATTSVQWETCTITRIITSCHADGQCAAVPATFVTVVPHESATALPAMPTIQPPAVTQSTAQPANPPATSIFTEPVGSVTTVTNSSSTMNLLSVNLAGKASVNLGAAAIAAIALVA